MSTSIQLQILHRRTQALVQALELLEIETTVAYEASQISRQDMLELAFTFENARDFAELAVEATQRLLGQGAAPIKIETAEDETAGIH